MRRIFGTGLCLLGLLAPALSPKAPNIAPFHIAAGAVLTFHLQNRLNPGEGNAVDALPKGTLLRVRMLDSVDSNVDRDGSEFHGSMVSPLLSGDAVIIDSQAEVIGIFAVLRSKSHPEGFRYELLVTGVKDHGKFYTLTASLDSTFADPAAQPVAGSKDGTRENFRQTAAVPSKLP